MQPFRILFSLVLLSMTVLPSQALSMPPNDDFGNAIQLTGASGQISGSNESATGEDGEPNHADIYDLQKTTSVWWTWQAPESCTVSFDTHGSAFDTVLAVYTGSDLIDLAEVAANDDDGTTNRLYSGVSFSAQSCAEYRVALGGYQGDTGDFILNWRYPPANENPDTWEDDDTPDQANIIVLNNKTMQRHYFQDQNDVDWVKFYAVNEQLPYGFNVLNRSSETNVVIDLYDTDGQTLLKTADYYLDGQNEYLSWYCTKEGVYFIKISNANSAVHGEDTAYDLQAFLEVAEDAGVIKGRVKSMGDTLLYGVRIKSSNNVPALSHEDGSYFMKLGPGNLTLFAELEGFKLFETEIVVEANDVRSFHIQMEPVAEFPMGDTSGDHAVDLKDAILALKALTGNHDKKQMLFLESDVNSDDRVGMEEAIYILKEVAK